MNWLTPDKWSIKWKKVIIMIIYSWNIINIVMHIINTLNTGSVVFNVSRDWWVIGAKVGGIFDTICLFFGLVWKILKCFSDSKMWYFRRDVSISTECLTQKNFFWCSGGFTSLMQFNSATSTQLKAWKYQILRH